MSTKCRHCGSASYGSGCINSPTRKHEHRDDEKHCEWCGSTSNDKTKYKGAHQIYRALTDNVGWFDDQDFLVPGLRIVSAKKSYKQYVTNEYTVAYQDIGLPSYSFDAISNKIKEQLFLLQKLLGDGKLDAFFQSPELAEEEDDANIGRGADSL